MAMTLLITASMLILTMMGISLSQLVLAHRTTQRNDALEAAEAALDAAIGAIRTSASGQVNVDGYPQGVLKNLPCNATDGFTIGGSTGSGSAYKATVTYIDDTNPQGQTYPASTLNQFLSQHGIACTGQGAPAEAPFYAVIQATGSDAASGPVAVPSRTIDETYTFQTTDQNIPGGLIYDYLYAQQGPGFDLCLADNNADGPQLGDHIYLETCALGSPDQMWAYGTYDTIELTATEVSAPPGLCATSNTSAGTVTLQTCLTSSDPNFYTQQWGVDDVGDLDSVATGGGPGNPRECITQNWPALGNEVYLANASPNSTCDAGFSSTQTWYPSAQAGAGDAGPNTEQYVNYDEFGRCMDVTNQNTSWQYLIDYMCKQFPDPSQLAWNQKFAINQVTYMVDGVPQSWEELITVHNGPYCLTSPDATPNLTEGVHAWVTVTACPELGANNLVPAGDSNLLWNVNDSTTYNVTDFYGNCLETDVADQGYPAGAGGDNFSTLATQVCNGSTAEKWNAPAITTSTGIDNAFEPSLGGN